MIATILFNFFIGLLFGMLSQWNKKVFFGVIVALVIFAIVFVAVVGLEEIDKSINVLKTIVGVVSTGIGFWMGTLFFDTTIGDKKEE